MAFEEFGPQDFADNDLFRRWVLQPDGETQAYWEIFLSLHPEKEADMLKAKALILAVKGARQHTPDELLVKEMWQNITRNTTDNISEESVSGRRSLRRQYIRWAVAASVLFLIVSGGFLYLRGGFLPVQNTPTYQTLTQAQTEKLLESKNASYTNLRVTLPDGSTVTLTPKSKVSYPSVFGNTRNVFLEGEGFFEVKKNANRPFIVYAGRLVTSVVGTSFWVKAPVGRDKVEVDVKTGCVAVASVASIKQAFSQPKPRFLLIANQQAVYSQNENSLVRSLVKNPEPVLATPQTDETVYVDKPVKEVFEEMEKTYNIHLVFDHEQLKNCRINSSFSNESFYERLDILCRILHASYEVVETQIVIKAKEGC